MAEYITIFQALKVQYNWGDKGFTTQFYNGLKDYVKDKVT